MINRFASVVAIATLMTLSGGCCGMKNFLFGRGARCGACTSLANIRPQFGNTMQAPYAAPSCQTPQYQPPVYQGGAVSAPQSGCGCNSDAGNYYANPTYGSQNFAGDVCGTCYGSASSHAPQYTDNCQCGVATDHYGPVASDPYLNSGQIYNEQIIGEQVIGSPVNGGQVIGGQVIGGQVLGEQVIGSPSYPSTPIGSPSYPSTPIGSDNFNARKVDSDGNRILWEEPLPPSVTPH